ncbi:hypothetical protein SEUCBS139899_001164 [Sporothrix eucalyptigena]|uniref:Cytochrome P450 n=1 Tax=Sporothrix eucalyptigena TaxID=1812306 RepID=A0ABP0B5F5_9PEZI
MLSFAFFAWLAGAGFALLVLASALRALRSPLRSVPGPFLARFTDAWYVWRVWRGHFEDDNAALHATYGSVVRYGPNRFVVADPDSARTIYGHGTHMPKSSWYDAWRSPGQPWSLFSDRDSHRHAANRRQYQSMYSLSSLVGYEPYVEECVNLLVQRLHELASRTTEGVDLGHWLQCYAFDVIGLITYSKRLGFLDRGDDVGGVIAALEDHLGYASMVGVYPGWHPVLFWLRNALASSKGVGRTYVSAFTRDCIDEHNAIPKARDEKEGKEGSGDRADLLTQFCNKHADAPDTFTAYHIASGCVSNMVAGSDTTAISLSAVLYYLLRYPDCMQRLRTEVDAAYAEMASGTPHLSFKKTQEMPYFQAVIKEALRMHPATGLPLERVVLPGGATIAGHFFPEETIVGINSWVQHRSPQLFGQDANDFRPERWLDEDAERVAVMNRSWMPFGLGSRTCIGRHISHLEISKLIPVLVRNFDFALVNKHAHWSTTNYWFVKPHNFFVRVSVRGEVNLARKV